LGLRSRKTIVFNGKMGIRKFGSTVPPFSKVVYSHFNNIVNSLRVERRVSPTPLK